MGAHPSHLDICCSRQLHNHTSCRPNLSDKLFCLADLVHTRCSTCLRDTTRDWAQPIFLTPPPKRLAQPTKSRLSWLLLDCRHCHSYHLFDALFTSPTSTTRPATGLLLERRLGVPRPACIRGFSPTRVWIAARPRPTTTCDCNRLRYKKEADSIVHIARIASRTRKFLHNGMGTSVG